MSRPHGDDNYYEKIDSPSMIDPRFTWLALPVWWLIVAYCYVKDLFRRKPNNPPRVPVDILKNGESIFTPEITEDDLNRLRLKYCVEQWPEAESGMYDPRCCRFPKSCSPHGYIEAVQAGNLTRADLEDE